MRSADLDTAQAFASSWNQLQAKPPGALGDRARRWLPSRWLDETPGIEARSGSPILRDGHGSKYGGCLGVEP